MGVDYSAVSTYGFVLGDEALSKLNEWNKAYGQYPDGDYPPEQLESFVGQYELLVYTEVGSISYGGEGEYAIGVSRLSSSVCYRDAFTRFVNSRELVPTVEELQELNDAAARLGVNQEFAFLTGMHVW